jgi:hypothetical protein
MKRYSGSAIILLICAARVLLAQEPSDPIAVGAFADYFRLSNATPGGEFPRNRWPSRF